MVERALSDVSYFSRHVLRMPLYEYQRRPVEAVVDSVLRRQGLEFLLIFPRQSGKNEAVAHLLVYLLNVLQRTGGNIVFGATGDGLGRGIRRLEQRLDNGLNRGRWRRGSRPVRRALGKASVIFMSTHPLAASRGETADWLLVIDEMQDQLPAHLEAVFEPMRAAHNASALYIGTVRLTTDALWLKRLELLRAEQADERPRVFVVGPEQVVAENRAYGRFLEGKVARLGRRHPIVASEYFNEPVDGHGRLFDRRRLDLMRGSHRRQSPPGRWAGARPVVVATLDVGGQDEAATEPLARLANPGRDYTVAHVFNLTLERPDDPGPTYRALDVFVDQGSRHFQSAPGRPALAQRLAAWLASWQIDHLVADESGVGAGLVDFLSARLGGHRVSGYNFATGHGKAALGSAFISVVETGRFRYWRQGEEEPLSDAWWFYRQLEACTYELPTGGRFERDLRWGVPPGARCDTPLGPMAVHDDRLISAALVAVCDNLYRQGHLSLARGASAVIRPVDPLTDEELRF
jgi:hypothetical protein